MTTEEKAKAYDEALKKAKKYHEEYWQVDAKDITETLFPQLCESEDERIRKELVEKITNLACGCFISQEQKQRFIHYLEKQKEQKPAEWSEKNKTIIEGACFALEVYGHTKLASSLKSLRPSWKPSEEQMEALRYVAYEHGNSSLSPYSIANKTLASLYEQLKKL